MRQIKLAMLAFGRTLIYVVEIEIEIAVARLSVVCNVRAPYSGGSNFRQYFYGIRYLDHGDRPRGTPPPGELNTIKRGSQI